MIKQLAAAASAVVILTASACSVASAAPEPGHSVTAPAGTSATPAAPSSASTAQASPPSGFPATMADGWIYEPAADDSAAGISNALNQALPDANITGAVYRHPTVNQGALLVLIGERDIDAPIALYLIGAKGQLHREGLYTVCAENKKGDKEAKACVVETSPSVMILYSPGQTGAESFDLKSLGTMAPALQADL